jgi:hypothetical protein
MVTIPWKEIAKFVIVGVVVSVISFFMIQVLMASILVDFLESSTEDNAFVLVMIILWVGFVLMSVVNAISSYLLKLNDRRFKRREITTAIIIATVLNLFFWTILPFVYIRVTVPSLFEGLAWTEKVVLIPRTVAVFAVYNLPNPVIFWFLGIASYAVFYALTLRRYVSIGLEWSFKSGKRKPFKKKNNPARDKKYPV